jgi:hypothetical protein
MPVSLALAKGSPGPIVANQQMFFVVTVTNSGSASVTLQSLTVSESTESDAKIGEIPFLTPNVPAGVGNPTIAAGASVNFGFPVVFNGPGIGPSPNNPGGAAPFSGAMTPDATFILQAQSLVSDGTVASVSLPVPVLSSIAPFPVPAGGALYLQQGSNLMTLALMGAL